jgi:TonB-linked SusC/RagA family outer membrane protein
MMTSWKKRSGISSLAKKMLHSLTLLALVLVTGQLAFAQTTVTGTVTDASNGTPLPTVNVLVQGTTVGTSTDLDGNYSITVPEGYDVLTFSYIGYITVNIPIEGRSVINVGLAVDEVLLDDIVVVGYGSQSQKEITASVTSVDESEFNKGTISSPAQLIQGKVPGLSIYNRGGNPNSSPTIRLRGISTVGPNTEPLIVIDGVVGGSLDNVDPADIASISVLKDGSAAAIYGTRGSSGVILIETKKGSAGAVTVNYSGSLNMDMVANTQPVMTASEYIAAGGNDLGSSNDWQSLVTRDAITHVHNLSVSGGSQSTTYRVSTNFRDVEGVLKKSGFQSINARASLTHRTLNDRLNLGFNFSTTKKENDFSFNEALRYAILYNPTAPIRFDNGGYFQAILFDNFNPVAIIEQNVNEGQSKNINYGVNGSFDVTSQITLSARFGQQYGSFSSGVFYPNTSFFRGLNRNGLASRFFNDSRATLFETFGSFAETFGSTNLTLTAGYSFQESQYEEMFLELGNFPTNAQGYHGIDLSGDRVVGGPSNVNVNSFQTPEDRIIAFFGRLNVTYGDGLFMNASVRREGSSKLGVDNQWGVFPSIGIGADLSNYVDLGPVNQLKLRAGYGVTGALPGPSGLSQDLFTYSFSGGGTVSKGRDGNPDLKWEEKAETNVGVDFGVFDDRLTGALDFYTRDINDFILEVDVPTDVYLSGRQYQNAGKLKTIGFEASASYDVIRSRDLTFNTGIIFSTYETTLEEFTTDVQTRAELGAPGQSGTNMIRVATGERIGQIWGPVFDYVGSDGAPVMKDLNGDGVIKAGIGDALAEDGDYKELGNGIPDFEIGWNNQVNYKNFELTAFFRGAFGHSLVNTYRAFYEPLDPGAINSYNRIKTDKAVDGLTAAAFSSLYVEKADFFKLDNVTLAYTFDSDLVPVFRSLQAYVNARNVFTITNYTGIDPEPVLASPGPSDNGGYPAGPDVLSPGIDRRNNYFTARTLTFGINIGF